MPCVSDINETAISVAKWLPIFFDHDDSPIEIRFLNADGRRGKVCGGWITKKDIAGSAKKIAMLATSAGGCYFTPQRLSPAVLGRLPRGFFPATKKNASGVTTPALTGDADVVSRPWLIIDLDPIRAKGMEKESSTDSEKAAAAKVANEITALLGPMGGPITVDSGNGYHLYFRLPNEAAGGLCNADSDPVAVMLRWLNERFIGAVDVDVKVYNPSRIMKVPGTWSRKGTATSDRPHRRSAVI
jgi:hypothetical protein